MCQSKDEGGRRCADSSHYSHSLRNLKAKEQYWVRKTRNNPEIDSPINVIRQEVENLKAAAEKYGKNVSSYTMEVTPAGQKVIDALYQSGLTPLIVGGSVRDKILGLESKDLDIEVYGGTTNEVVKSLRKVGHVDEVGKSFGVLKIVVDGEDIDVSLPRTDNKLGEGHKGFEISVDPHMTPVAASQRRDYTINALMYDTQYQVIIDPNNGLEDMDNKVLRHVSDAYDEDPLRVLRGVQMSSRFGFTLAPETISKAENLKKEYPTLSKERIQEEFKKLYIKGKDNSKAFETLQQTGWDECFPGLKEINTPELREKLKTLNSPDFTPEEKVVYNSAIITKNMNSSDRENFLQRTINNDFDRGTTRTLVETKVPTEPTNGNLRRWANKLNNASSIRRWVKFQQLSGNDTTEVRNILNKAEKLNIADHPEKDFVLGRDLLTLFPHMKPGIWVGNIMSQTREAQEDDVFRTPEDGLVWVKKNFSPESLESLNVRK